jgi:flagellin-like hook-associated protein FlgL
METQEINTLIEAVERIGILEVALFVMVIAFALERIWNARNNREANKPLTDAIGALTTAVVSGDKRAEENTRAWQRVVEANTAALERAAESKDKIASVTTTAVQKIDLLTTQEGAHFQTTSGKLDANAMSVKTSETTILAAVETGTKALSKIEEKLTEIQNALTAFGTLNTRLGDVTAQIGEVLQAVKALHQDVDARSTAELRAAPQPEVEPAP